MSRRTNKRNHLEAASQHLMIERHMKGTPVPRNRRERRAQLAAQPRGYRMFVRRVRKVKEASDG